MAIAEQELIEPATTLPRDAKPSELVRGWPEDRWCAGTANDWLGHFCAVGILAEEGGIGWSARRGSTLTDHAAVFVMEFYGIPHMLVCNVIEANDTGGKDAAAGVLEAAGF